MLRTSDSETEILLGNKQLLGIFFVVAILLGIAFYGGYMVGKAAPAKAAPTATATDTSSAPPTASATTSTSGGETHTVAPDTSSAEPNPTDATEPPLGTPKVKRAAAAAPPPAEAAPQPSGFAPESGQEFLQVAAVGRDEALAVADVLHAKGFRAHAIAKPGNSKIYRVLIGPVHDAADLSATRDALRKTGFREVIVQKY